MIFSQYKETCKVLLYYQTIGDEDIKDYVKKSIGNLLHENIDVHSRGLIAESPGDGVNVFQNFNHIVQTLFFLKK